MPTPELRHLPDGGVRFHRRPSADRETVALFQRDAQTKGAERSILVTLCKFTEPARKAAIVTSPTVDLIDGNRLPDLVAGAETKAHDTPHSGIRLTS